METPETQACFQGGPLAPTPQRPACHCPLPAMPAHHTPGPGGQREGATGEGGPCRLQSASASRLLWQREDGGGGAESFWKAGNVCPPSMEPNSSRSSFPYQTHVTTQRPGDGARPCCPGWPHPTAQFCLGCRPGGTLPHAAGSLTPSRATFHPDRPENAWAVTQGQSLWLPCPAYGGISELSQKQRLGRPDPSRDPKASGTPRHAGLYLTWLHTPA